MEAWKVKLPLRLDPYSFALFADAYARRGIDIEEALNIERRPIGQFTQYVVHGLKGEHGRQ